MKKVFTSILFTIGLYGFLHAQTLEKQIDQYLESYMNANNFSSTVFVAHQGKILYHKAFGLADIENMVPCQANTVYQIASVSKPFTAAAILWLEERGKLKTGDPLSKFIFLTTPTAIKLRSIIY